MNMIHTPPAAKNEAKEMVPPAGQSPVSLSLSPELAATPREGGREAPKGSAQAQAAPARRGIGRYTTWGLVLAVAGAGIWYEFLRDPAGVHEPAAPHAATAGLPPGEFRLSETEIRSLRIEPVQARAFHAERAAEGRIAYNDDRSTPVFTPYTGRVVNAGPRLGERVEAGSMLFEVETNDLVQAANDLLSAVDALNKSRTSLALSQRNAARQADMYAGRAASMQALEQARADAANAAADLRVQETAVAAARDRMRVLGRSPAQIAEVERTRHVDATVAVNAPIAGTVSQRRIGPGQWLNAGGSDPVFTIADLSTMWLVAAVREMDAPLVRVGQAVQVTVGALPGRTFDARITNMATGLDPVTRRLEVRAEVQDPDRLLKPEMFASFRIDIGRDSDAVAVPVSAVIFRGSDASVWEALDDNRFILRRITLGMRSGDMLEVVQGLPPGARIVTGGALFVDRAARID
ncbi:efflux RND transporter periplasmic adaptor subunit [Roseomonas sp. NAR14]|uniref:Efflux RND transporter periplasmic adaptor subunit n=1 Tax=Roseomonas acroporae TaxID=2937791 RepID=A0A9X2BVM6_9PROT|nr:efflux RND transporter periplasmic adaptor subunit [Roseomonas acroporae]MCK8786823.1 efflux RND transporter periplasmic adaptor subunit [Roseomonas acroporae]